MPNIPKSGQVYGSNNQGMVVNSSGGANPQIVVNQGANQGMVLIQPERQMSNTKQPDKPVDFIMFLYK